MSLICHEDSPLVSPVYHVFNQNHSSSFGSGSANEQGQNHKIQEIALKHFSC